MQYFLQLLTIITKLQQEYIPIYKSKFRLSIEQINTVLHYRSYTIQTLNSANPSLFLSLITSMKIRNTLAKVSKISTPNAVCINYTLKGINVAIVMYKILEFQHVQNLSHSSQQFQIFTIYNLYRLIFFFFLRCFSHNVFVNPQYQGRI